MPTKITVIYDNPTDPAAFETGYAAEQVELARQLPGLQKIETSKVWPKEDGSPTPAYRMVDLYFPDYDTASAAVTTPGGGGPVPEHLRAGDRRGADRCSPTSKSPDRQAPVARPLHEIGRHRRSRSPDGGSMITIAERRSCRSGQVPAARSSHTIRETGGTAIVLPRLAAVAPDRSAAISACRSLPGRGSSSGIRGRTGSRQYDVYLPAGPVATEQSPMVLLLHGCQQTGDGLRQGRPGFYGGRRRGGFRPGRRRGRRCSTSFNAAGVGTTRHQRRDSGEPAILRASPRGPASTVRLADRSAAGLCGGPVRRRGHGADPGDHLPGSVRRVRCPLGDRLPLRDPGLPRARCDGRPRFDSSHGGIGGEMAPVVLIHGTDDRVVRPPNADRIVDQWLASRDAAGTQGLNRVRPLATTRAFVVDGPALHQDPLVHRPRPPGPRVLAHRRARARLVGWRGQGPVHRPHPVRGPPT